MTCLVNHMHSHRLWPLRCTVMDDEYPLCYVLRGKFSNHFWFDDVVISNALLHRCRCRAFLGIRQYALHPMDDLKNKHKRYREDIDGFVSSVERRFEELNILEERWNHICELMKENGRRQNQRSCWMSVASDLPSRKKIWHEWKTHSSPAFSDLAIGR